MPKKHQPVGTDMKPCINKLGKFIRKNRLKLGLSQHEFAKLSGGSQSHISAIEVGLRKYIGENALQSLAKALKCDLKKLKKHVPVKQFAQPKTERGKFIRARRVELGLSLPKFARRINKNPEQVRQLELSRNPTMRYSMAKILARALRVELQSLAKFTMKDFKPPACALGQLVRTRRDELSMSGNELARKIGVKTQMVNQIEHGQCPLCQSKTLVGKLAKALKLKKSVLEAALPARKMKKIATETPLAKFLNNCRIELGLTFSKISELTGIPTSSLSSIFRGKVYPSAKLREKIVQVLQCNIPAKFLLPESWK